MAQDKKTLFDVVILGSGPAGLTASIYCQRFGLSTILVAGKTWGGQLQLTTEVENFPGMGQIMGPQLMKNMRDHVTHLGVPILDLQATGLQTDKKPFTVTLEDGQTVRGKTVIVATGADTRWLGVPSEARLRGHGVSSCAPCDAFFFRGKPVAVVGGGDTAMEETQVIAKVSPDVILIHRRDEFRAQQAMQEKVSALKQVRFLYNTRVVDLVGEPNLTGMILETTAISPKQNVQNFDELVKKFGGTKQSETQWVLPRVGVFVAIGLDPNTKVFTDLHTDSHGYVLREEERDEKGGLKYFTKTNIPGIFTAGDVHDARYKQAITAAGFGCMSAIDVQTWLAEQE